MLINFLKKSLQRQWSGFYRVSLNDKDFDFIVTHPLDAIQRCHLFGKFYDPKELELIKSHFGNNLLRVADIGANVGNHSIFFAHFMNCEIVIPVEPNPRILKTLRCNLGLNWHPAFDLSLVGYGLSDQEGYVDMVQGIDSNIGASSINPSVRGSIPVLPGYQALAHKNINFIKIDAEGHELNILAGLIPILDQERPTVYVETRDDTQEPVYRLLHAHGYIKAYTYNMYSDCMNTMFVPKLLVI
jgi:FkbM family methyltransferase